MDPNEALRGLRSLMGTSRRYLDRGIEVKDWRPILEEMVELFDGLDHWLTMGGFLPRGWGERGKCAKRLTDRRDRWTYVCSKPPGHGGPHEDERRHWKWTGLRDLGNGVLEPVVDPDPLGGPVPGVTGQLPEDEA